MGSKRRGGIVKEMREEAKGHAWILAHMFFSGEGKVTNGVEINRDTLNDGYDVNWDEQRWSQMNGHM